ncbi:hypothetical protein [Butyrivibrio sp. LB2008]|uniref:hypothetical protein n=1 Tax=Butyrivibrio sp. LB2008 TaxID=1408305 RepID=UPI00047C1449|nr:hypothetical protein [Butyrivibrio sp. LB2008]
MESIKDILKAIAFIMVLLIILVVIRNIPEPAHNISTSYKEWTEQIGLNDTENVKVFCYDGDNSITVGFEDENGVEGYKELCNIINAHNKFVDENSDYFPEGIKISFENSDGDNHPTKAVFFNDWSENYGISDYLGDLNRPYTAKIQYAFIDMSFADTSLIKNGVEIDVPVIILLADSYAPGGSSLAFLNKFKNAEQVIMDFRSVDYDKGEICKEIKEYSPNIEVYSVGFTGDRYCLEKCP